MKKLIILVAILLSILVVQNIAFAESSKIGYVTLGKIFEDYQKVTDSNKEIDVVKEDIKKVIEGINKLKEGFDTLSPAAQEERKNQVLAKQEEIRKRTFEVRKDEDRILREILKDIENVSMELRKKKKLTYIIDDRLILDGPKEMDLTDDVIEILNERYKK
ncbi:MAG: OmpH family outer membrane protein [Candidatus Omnitrophica bacterium]|nr:OmpH family outer membrane protein [Candidatus Omnitrophota bacterium]